MVSDQTATVGVRSQPSREAYWELETTYRLNRRSQESIPDFMKECGIL